MIIKDLSYASVLSSMQKQLNEVESQRTRERYRMLDYYEGSTDAMEADLKKYFDSASLQQTPMVTEAITRKIVDTRASVYKTSPERECDERYFEYFDDLDSSMLQLERLTYLLGTQALRARWHEEAQQLSWQPVTEFYPLFEEYAEEPSACIYPLYSYSQSADKRNQMFAFWSDEEHYLIDGKGQIVDTDSNPDRSNPYGIKPIVYAHRSFLSTDWFREGCGEVVAMNKAVNCMLTEANLAMRLQMLGQPVLTGVDTLDKLKMGSDRPIVLSEGSDLNFKASSGDLQKFIEAIRFMVDSVAYNNNLKTKWSVGRESMVSGESLKMAEIELTESLMTDAQMIWRPVENKRFEIDRAIIEYETGVKLDEAYSVDFSERRFPLTASEERAEWEWQWKHGLKSKKDWFRYNDKDNIEEEQIDETIARVEEEGAPKSPEQTQTEKSRFNIRTALGA